MAIQSKLQLEKYQYGVDVRKTRQLYGMSGKVLYLGQWISRRSDQIIIVEMTEAIARHEAFFYRELNGHDHIIRTFGYVENNINSTIFVQEYALRGDLANLIMDNQIIMSQMLLMEIFSQVIDAMTYVASKSIVHGDLGCRNVLVCKIDPLNPKNTLVKITDFGLARSLNQLSLANEDSSIIPIRYCAPEILENDNQRNYSEKSDVYSMGVFMWEALSNGEMPYSSINSDHVVRIKKLNDERLIRPSICDRPLWILMEQCWVFNPNERITFEQMKEQLADIKISDQSDIYSSIPTFQPLISFKFKLDTDIRMKECLAGSFDKTFDAQWLSREDRPVVLIKMDKPPTESEYLFYTELMSHSHIIHTFGFVENNLQSLILLQERAPHGNLQLLLQKNQFYPSTNILVEIFSQIIEAMFYITQQKLVHGDLRCANVLVFEMDELNPKKNLVKLTNFSSAHQNDPTIVKTRRSPIPVRYCALEILRSAGQSNYSEFSDVYSMGVLMWEACSHGQLPYGTSTLNSEVRQRKLNKEKLVKPWLCNDQIWSIMEDCWHNETETRYSFEQMKTRISRVNLELEKTYQYEMNIDVRMGNQLYGKFGKKFHEGEWIPKQDTSIILLIMDEQTARKQVPFYFQLNSHSHIIHTFGLVKHKIHETVLVQERASHGNLQFLLRNNQFQPSASVLVRIFLQIIDAMIYMVDQRVIHGDLRCENILVFQMNSLEPKENLVKLTNFNSARHNDSSVMDNCQTVNPVRYCAPEILKNSDQSSYSESSDVYSMGVLMWEACSKGDIPYGSDASDDDVRQRRLNNEILSKPNECDHQIWTIIEYCFYREPETRFNFRGLQTLFSNISITCLHCQKQYSINDMSNHQQSCRPKPPPPPPPPIKPRRFPPIKNENPQKPTSPEILTERSPNSPITLNNDQTSSPLPTTNQSETSPTTPPPSPLKTIADRIRSLFGNIGRKKEIR